LIRFEYLCIHRSVMKSMCPLLSLESNDAKLLRGTGAFLASLISSMFLFCVFGATSHANLSGRPLVEIQTVLVGDAGNADESTWGGVAYPFRIGRFEVTAEQYCVFLNAVAKSDPYGLFDVKMQDTAAVATITRSGSSGSYSYSVIAGRERVPIAYISWFDAARFANWMHNGATAASSTETGAYELNGATNGTSFSASSSAKWRLPTGDEFFKAGYYKGGGTNSGYWRFATQSDEVPGNQVGHSPNQANFGTTIEAAWEGGALTRVASYTASPSYYGTFDQSGSLFEWIDDVQPNNPSKRYLVGGSQGYDSEYMQFGYMYFWDNASIPSASREITGFRLVKTDISEDPQMVYVAGGSLPDSSQLSGQQVGAFLIRKTETTLEEWIDTKIWAKANGYNFQWPNDQLDISLEWYRLYRFTPVGSVSYYDIAAWCNAKSEREGLQPAYMIGSSVYRGGMTAPTVNMNANGYRMPFEAEWEWAARGGTKSQGFVYSGSSDLDEVGWWRVSAPGTGAFPVPVALKKANELGLFDMSGNSFEVCNDTNASGRRIARGGACFNRAASNFLPESVFRVDDRSASTKTDDRDLWDLGGIWGQTFRLVRNASPGADSDGDGVTDYREVKDGTDPNDASSFNPLSRGLVAYFPFTETPADESGYNRVVDFGNIQPTSGAGAFRRSYYFSGESTSYHLVSDIPIPRDNSYTWSIWIKPEVLKPRNFLLSRITGFNLNESTPWLEITGNGQLLFSRSLTGDSVADQFSVSSVAGIVQVNRWVHLVAVSDTHGQRQIFVNGVSVASGTDLQYGAELPLLLIGADRYLSGHPAHGGGNANFQGYLGSVRVYDRALSTAEVGQLYQQEVGGLDSDNDGVTDYREIQDGTDPNDPESFNPLSRGLVAYYPFNGTLNDESGYAKHLVEVSGAQLAESFDGANDALRTTSLTYAKSLANSGIVGNQERTYSLWVLSDGPQPWPQGIAFGIGTSGAQDGNASGVVINSRNGGIVAFDNNGPPIETGLVAGLYDRWQHVVVTYVDNAGSARIYLNGREVPFVLPDNNPLATIATSEGPIGISTGRDPSDLDGPNGRGFNGLVDNVRLYNRALSAAEALQLFESEVERLDSDQDGLIDLVELRLADLGFDPYIAQDSVSVQGIFSDPNLAGLFTQTQYTDAFDDGRQQGRDDVISQPGRYGLFNESSIADINLGGVVLRKLGNAVNLEVQVQMTPDINAQPFTNLPYRHLLYIDGLPSDKTFLRIRALGPQ
jgi:sulfatase modifying factor 1